MDLKAPTVSEEFNRFKELARPVFVKVALVSVVVGLLAIAPIAYLREVYGPVMNSRSESLLISVTFLLVLAILVTGFFEWIRTQFLNAILVMLSKCLSKRVFYATFNENLLGNSGASTPLSDLRTLRNFVVSPTVGAIFETPVGLLVLSFVFFIHPVMGYVALVGVALSVTITLTTQRLLSPYLNDATKFAQKSQQTLSQYSRGGSSALAMGMLPVMEVIWSRQQDAFLKSQAIASNVQGLGAALNRFIMLLQGSAVLGVGVFLTIIGVLGPEDAALLIVAKFLGYLAIQPLMRLIQGFKSVLQARDSYNRLLDLLSRAQPDLPRMNLPKPRGKLVLTGVGLRAPHSKSKKTLLQGISLNVEPGQVLLIIGGSGSGKSTLARVILGIWPVLIGEVRLDGVDMSTWQKSDLGRYLGYLPQDVELFDGSVAQNIRRFGPIDADKSDKAVQLAGLETLIAGLPNGLNTEIGDSGAFLSAGQRQRIGLARALYGDPKLVVLDEPNAHLDEAGDKALSNAIRYLKRQGSTVILVSHRREVVRDSDLLLLLSSGKQIEFGPTHEVLARLMRGQEHKSSSNKPL